MRSSLVARLMVLIVTALIPFASMALPKATVEEKSVLKSEKAPTASLVTSVKNLPSIQLSSGQRLDVSTFIVDSGPHTDVDDDYRAYVSFTLKSEQRYLAATFLLGKSDRPEELVALKQGSSIEVNFMNSERHEIWQIDAKAIADAIKAMRSTETKGDDEVGLKEIENIALPVTLYWY